jgi:flavin-dependent dehydrogenase
MSSITCMETHNMTQWMTIGDNRLDKLWDCVVIGAGPSGALAARQIASGNKQVLLIDKSVFPRSKVCGCCFNGLAQLALSQAGLSNLLTDNNAVPLSKLALFDGNRRVTLVLPTGSSLSRKRFDMALINAAIERGAQFLSATTATVLSLEGLPKLQIRSQDVTNIIQSKIVIVADGLAGRSLDLIADFRPTLELNSRFGAGIVLNEAPELLHPGQIYMACGTGGYVGMVRLEDGSLDVAAAFDRQFVRDSNGPAMAAARVLENCQLLLPQGLTESRWIGTDSLTRSRSQVSAHRLFVIGDASGYAEPFTGEGIAWALWSGLAVADLAVSGINSWNHNLANEWHKINKKLVRQRTRSQMIAWTLRNDLIRHTMIDFLSALPAVASPLVRRISGVTINPNHFTRPVVSVGG